MPTTYSPGLPGFPAPMGSYDRENEAQFRRQLERTLLDQVTYIEQLIQDEASVSVHVLADATGLGTRHTISGSIAGAVLRASGATAANFQRLTAADIDPGTFPAGAYVFQGALSGITTLAMSGQLTNTVVTGSAPFVLSSTTKVANLNADLLDDQSGAFYQDAGNLTTGNLAYARLPTGSGSWDSGVGTSVSFTRELTANLGIKIQGLLESPADPNKAGLFINASITGGPNVRAAGRYLVSSSGAGDASAERWGHIAQFLWAQQTNIIGGFQVLGDVSGAVIYGNVYGVQVNLQAFSPSTITDLQHIRVGPIVQTATITNHYGLYVDSITQGTNKYAIYTNEGQVRFGDSGRFERSLNGTLAIEVVNTDAVGTSARADIGARDSAGATVQLAMFGLGHALANQGWLFTSGVSNNLVFGTVGTERARIPPAGGLHIGGSYTAPPAAGLRTEGQIVVEAGGLSVLAGTTAVQALTATGVTATTADPRYDAGTIAPGLDTPQGYFRGWGASSSWPIQLAIVYDASWVDQYLVLNATLSGTRAAPTLTKGGAHGAAFIRHNPQANQIVLGGTSSVSSPISADTWITVGVAGAVSMGALTAAGVTLSVGDIHRSIATDATTVSGGTTTDLGASVQLVGESHATAANDIRLRVSAANKLVWDHSATTWYFGNYLGTLPVQMGALTATTGVFTGALSGDSTLQIDGNTLLGTTTAATGSPRLDILGGTGAGGAHIVLSQTLSDVTAKIGSIGVRHYTNVNVPFGFIQGLSDVSGNFVRYGRGVSSGTDAYAATIHEWFTASNITTNVGTLAVDLTGVGAASQLYARGSIRTDAGLQIGADVSLTRSAANVLNTTDTLSVGGEIRAVGGILDSAGAVDLLLKRNGADVLTLQASGVALVGESASLARLRLRGFYTASPSDPPTDQCDIIVIDNGATPVLRVRYNDAGTMKVSDLALV